MHALAAGMGISRYDAMGLIEECDSCGRWFGASALRGTLCGGVVRGIPQSLELRVMFMAVLRAVRDGSRFVLVSEPRLFQQLKEPSQLRVTKGA